MSIDLLLLIVAFVAFVLVALNVSPPRINLLGVGLACWVLTLLV